MVFAVYNVVDQNDKEEWLLMHCLRSFSIIDLLLSFEVHTDKTILAGWKEIVHFGRLMRVCKCTRFGDSIVLTGIIRTIFHYLQ